MRHVCSVALGLIISSGLAHAQEASCPAITDLASGMSAAIAEAELEQAGVLAAKAKSAALCQSQPHQTVLLALNSLFLFVAAPRACRCSPVHDALRGCLPPRNRARRDWHVVWDER